MVFANFDPWLGSASLSYANLLDPNSFRILGFNGSTWFNYIHI